MKKIKTLAALALAAMLSGVGATPAMADDAAALRALEAVDEIVGANLANSALKPGRSSVLEVRSPSGRLVGIEPAVDRGTIRTSVERDTTVVATNKSHSYVLTRGKGTPGSAYVVLEEPTSDAIHRFTITIDGQPATLKSLDGGWVTISDEAGNLENIISPAWALDAQGKPVQTHYEIDGSTLVQEVALTGKESYPVVADPALACDWLFCTVEMNRWETRQIGFYGGLGTLTAGICAPLLPAAGWPAAICAAAIAGMALWIQGTAADAYDQGKCLGIRAMIYSPTATMHPVIYGPGGNCY
ncbi:hypothetical protein [Chryseoglobus sp. 28M-23]|uniref:hypothetical protein n=1 Tax=Chryseoglobus sp. 28M-23 TaxID=2772253 RepID=UPI001747B07F|nr:hypothetical protein [Chryseoglobus sp. 28M-23]QOD94343.1 hypothetical protein IE160_03735 [Chryseoglobus sp. 28M-23]